jgi:hypothetical protein
MAFRSLFAHRFFEPDGFQKPPFHTYVNSYSLCCRSSLRH